MAYFDCIVGGSGKGNTLVVTCADDLAGATITCTNGTKTYTKTCPSTAPYEVTFYGLAAGTWTVSATVSGNTYTTTVVVVDCAALLGGFSWRTWVDTARFLDSSDYNSLDEVLADELAVRELCLEHACVDYLATVPSVNADIETVINNDLFAKWVNNSDYSLDVLGANVAIKALMDTANKYGYGEWTLVGQVPKMTSNTAPYGEVSASATLSGYDAYKAFNSTNSGESDCWYAQGTRTGYLRYKFATPCCVKQVTMRNRNYGTTADTAPLTFEIRGSNDNFVNDDNLLGSFTNTNTASNGASSYDVNNDNEYLYYEINVLSTVSANNVSIGQLQFYSWAPKGNVPVMTSDTAPYGEAIGSSVYNNNSNYARFKAFDGVITNGWAATAGTSAWIGYKFANPVEVRKVRIKGHTATVNPTGLIQYSDDNVTWNNTSSSFTITGSEQEVDVASYGFHLYWKVYQTSTNSGETYNTYLLQFYGRELSVSVPAMTTNTTPYGEVSADKYFPSNGLPYYAFDGNDSTSWGTYQQTDATKGKIRYSFTTPVCVKEVLVYVDYSGGYRAKDYKINASDDGVTYTPITSGTFTNKSQSTIEIVDLSSNNTPYRYWQLEVDSTYNGAVTIKTLQFYGLDYSEKEFEEGTTKKWLYDHGVELETFTTNTSGSGSVATKDADSLYNSVPASTNVSASALVNIDLTNYSLARMVVGKEAYGSVSNYASGGLVVLSTTTPTYNTSPDAQNYPLPPINDKNNIALDISSFNTTKAIGIFMRNVSSGSLKKFRADEIWLE
jgi:hypothetical protein